MLRFFSIFCFIFFSSFKLLASETKGVVSTIQPINSLVNAVIGNTGKTISLIPAKAISLSDSGAVKPWTPWYYGYKPNNRAWSRTS